jgi:hypothetical protein
MRNCLIVCAILFMIIGCKKDDGSYSVVGKISNVESSGSEVTVKLSNSEQSYSTNSTSSGEYEFSEVQPGEYLLLVSQNKTKGEVERTVKVIVGESNKTVDVLLPDPVQLFCTSHPATSVTLNWTQSYDEGFREYKIYKGYNYGLDETTGTLIYVTTSQTDTSFIDSTNAMNIISPSSDYYYRVFVLDDMGEIAGSNVLHVTTDSVPHLYTLSMVTNFSTNSNFGTVAGVAFDGQYLWLVYRYDLGGFYDNDRVILAKYDNLNFNLIDTFSFHDRYEPIGGLTSDGENLWVQYSASGTGSNFIREIDPVSKLILNNYNTDYGVSGLSFFNNVLYLNYYYASLDLLNPNSGALLGHYILPTSGSNDYGVAVRTDEVWISERLSMGGFQNNSIYVLNSDFTYKGIVKVAYDYPQICFMNNQLVVATPSRVYIYDIL